MTFIQVHLLTLIPYCDVGFFGVKQATPLTALKFAELVVRAGFPPGVINVVPGPGESIQPIVVAV